MATEAEETALKLLKSHLSIEQRITFALWKKFDVHVDGWEFRIYCRVDAVYVFLVKNPRFTQEMLKELPYRVILRLSYQHLRHICVLTVSPMRSLSLSSQVNPFNQLPWPDRALTIKMNIESDPIRFMSLGAG